MEKRGISQEWLKVIACLSMLLDHIGATLLPGIGLRTIGRLAFPIYCFLLCEGVRHTHSPWRYLLRLAAVAVVSELPYDLLFYGGMDWGHQNTLLTLLLGCGMLLGVRRTESIWCQMLIIFLCCILAQLCHSDYGGLGILMIAVLWMTEGRPKIRVVMVGLVCLALGLGELTALLALIPIGLYSGKKITSSRILQWGFYLFYPMHLVVLYIISKM